MNLRSATGLIVVLTVVFAVCSGLYSGLGFSGPSEWVFLLWYIAWWWALTLWVVHDARERHVPLAFDQGLFIYLAWPVYIPVYLVRSRGGKGLAWAALFAGMYAVILLAVHAVTAVIWAVLRQGG